MERAVISTYSNGSSTQDITHGGSWTPKAAIFQWSRANSSENSFEEHLSYGYGFTDGTNQRCVGISSEDNQARGDTGTVQGNASLMYCLSPSGTVTSTDAVATFNSWLSNGIRINWTDQPATAFYFTVILLGGSDITNVKVDTLMTGTGTGDVSYSSIAWQADYGMFLSAGLDTENAGSSDSFMSLGMATGTSGNVNQWVQSVYGLDNPITMSTRQYYSHSKIVMDHNAAIQGTASFSGFNSSGFTINISDPFPASYPIYFLIIKGGAFTVGNATEPTSTGDQTITTGKDVKCVGIFGLDLATENTLSTGAIWTSGWSDGTNQRCIAFEDRNGSADSIVVSQYANSVYQNITANATASSSTIDDEIDTITSMSSTNFVAHWNNIGQALPYRYCTFGNGTLQVTGTYTLKHDIRQTFIDTNTLKHDIRQYFTDTNTILYNVMVDVADSNTFIYDITSEVIDTNTIIHNIQQELIDSNTLLYDIRNEFTDTNSILYDIRNELTNSNTFIYNVRQEFTDTNTLLYDIRQELIDSNTFMYDIRQEFTDTNTLLYDIRQELIDTNTFIYDIEAVLSVIKSLSLLHDIKQELTDTNTFIYDIRQEFIDTNTLIYKIGNILYVKLSTYTANTSTGDQDLTFTPNGSDPDWTPKGAIAWWTRSTNTVDTFAEHASIGMGFTDGTTSICNAFTTEDNQGISDTAGSTSDAAFVRTLVPTGTVQAQDSNATFVQWLTNGLRINWDDAPAAAFKIHILFLGGDDLTDVHVGTFTGNTSIGIQDITAPDFVPDGVMFMSGDYTSTFTPTVYNKPAFGVGAADSASSEWARYIVSETGRDISDTWRYYYDKRSIVAPNAGTGSPNSQTEYVTAISNGFRINWTLLSGTTFKIGYIAFKGCSIGVGTATEPDLTGDQVINTACPVKAVMIISNMSNTNGGAVGNARMSVGAGTLSSEMATVALHDYDGVGTMVNVARYETDSIYLAITANATASSSTIDDEASLSSVSPTGFTLNWSNIGGGITFSYITFGEIVEKNGIEDQNTLIYNIRMEIPDTLTLKYDIISQPVASRKVHFDIGDIAAATYIPVHSVTDYTYHIDYISYLQAISKQLSLLHDIRQSLADTNTVKYDVREELTDTNTIIHDIRNEFTDTNSILYDIRQSLTDINTLLYNISYQHTDTNSILYDIRNEFTDTNSILYDIRNEFTDTNSFLYDVRNEFTDINSLLYDVRNELTDINTFIYNIETTLAVIKTLSLLHNINQEFTDINTIIHDIRNEFTDTNSFLYNIRSDITDTNTFIHNIESQLTNINTLLYNIRNQITDTDTFIYDIRQDLTNTNILRYSILQDATNTNTLLYNIESQIVDSNTLIHDIRNETIDSNSLLYNIRTDVTDTNTLKYDIRQALIDTNTFIYNIEIQGGFNARMVSVLSNSGTGTQDITFSASPSWTPKIAIVKFSNSSTSADTFQEHVGQGIGFTDGTNSRCLSTASEDNQARSDTARLQTNNALISALSSTGTVTTVDAVATFSQWLTNGMQINWTDAPTTPFYIHVLFLGGNDITNFDVGTLSTGTGTGNISITSLSYQPDFGLFLTGSSLTENTGVVSASMSIGAATSSSSQWVQSIYALDNPATMDTNEYYSHSNVAVEHTTTVNGLASFSSFNSNGFTLNVSNGFSSSSPIYYLVIKGGTFAVGNATEIGSQTTQQITTDKDTKAVMMFGLDTGTADSVQAGCMQTIGMGTGSSEQGVEVFDDTDNVADSIVVSRHDTDQIYLNITSNATATSSTLDDEASLDSVSSTGFTLNWTNVGSALPFRYITFGTSVVKISVTDTNTFLYNILHSVIDTNTLKHDIRSEIIDTNTLIYNVRTDLTDVNTFIYNISTDVTNSNTIKYDIISQIVNTNTLIHNIIESITDTNTLLFNIGESLTNTNTIKYDIRESLTDINTIIYDIDGAIGAVVKTLTLLHNIMNETTDTNTIKYDIRQELTDSNTLLHNILNEIDKINNFLYDIRTESTDTNTFIYDIRQEFTDVNTLIHDIRESLTDTNTVKYDIINEVIDTNTIIYNITEQITETNTLLYNIRQELTNSGTFKFDVRQILTDINTFIYDIEGVTGIVEKALTLVHNIISQITDTNTIKYDIKQDLTNTNSILYDIKQDVIDTNTFLHNIISQITDTNILKYNIYQDLTNTNSILYDIKQDVPKTLTFLYEIISQPIKTNNLLYNISQELIDTNTFIYNVRINASNFNTLLYNIVSQPVLSGSFLYDIISQPIKTSTMLYHVRQDASNSNTFIYNIGNEAVKQLNTIYLIMNEISIPYTLRYNLELNAVVMLDNRPDKSYLEIVDLIVNILKSNWST